MIFIDRSFTAQNALKIQASILPSMPISNANFTNLLKKSIYYNYLHEFVKFQNNYDDEQTIV
jgi:hypothetical protein